VATLLPEEQFAGDSSKFLRGLLPPSSSLEPDLPAAAMSDGDSRSSLVSRSDRAFAFVTRSSSKVSCRSGRLRSGDSITAGAVCIERRSTVTQ
jgi:hypothetical protein